MGYNTTVHLLNDALDVIERNPEQFVRGILEGMHNGDTFSVGNHLNPAQVMRTGHADEFRLYSGHQNLMVELSPYAPETERLMESHPQELRSRISMAKWLLYRLEEELDKQESS